MSGVSAYPLRTSYYNVDTLTNGAVTVDASNMPLSAVVNASGGTGASATPVNFSINAKNSNSLFGTSSTVQPAGLLGLCLIRAYQA